MKKAISVILAILMILSFSACGSASAEELSSAVEIEADPSMPEGFETAKVVKTGSGITVKSAEAWKEQYPEIYASYMKNEENRDTVSYVEEYPMIGKLYNNMGFYKFYDSARAHNYTVTDITNTGRPHKLANCFTCKSPNMTAMVNNEGDSVYATEADESFIAQLTEPISCYNCHANESGDLVVTHTYLADAMGEDLNKVDARNLSCAQCHNEYYFNPVTKATTLPYSDLATMTPDAMLDFYNNRLIVDGQSFADYTNPITGVRQIKVQHPEFETYMGEGSVHKDTFTCADCHMGRATTEEGKTYVNHYLSSPLENEALLKNNCSTCHVDLKAEVRDIQETTERRTYAVGYELELLHDKLAEAVAQSTVPEGEEAEDFTPAYTEAELNTLRTLSKNAQFYWDFVFVENSEGAHNSALDSKCLDKAEALCNQALGLFKR